MKISVDGTSYELRDVETEMPLLWVLRDELKITAPKYGCGIAVCGACTVMDGATAIRSCSVPIGSVTGPITTIAHAQRDPIMAAVQRAWIEEQVAQCGYCQGGQIIQAASLLAKVPEPSDEQIDQAMSGNLCRCGTYLRIRSAIHAAAKLLKAA